MTRRKPVEASMDCKPNAQAVSGIKPGPIGALEQRLRYLLPLITFTCNITCYIMLRYCWKTLNFGSSTMRPYKNWKLYYS